MNSDEIIFQQYKLYSEQKEKFVDRNFKTNKFYQVFILTLIVTMLLTKDYSFVFHLSSTFVLSAMGLSICTLWWINVDSYNLLIKIKLSKVIEELEKQLPVHPHIQEYAAIKEMKKNKREFLFADTQKLMAMLFGFFFFTLFLDNLVKIIYN